MSEIVYCKICKTEFEATTEEVASYLCHNCMKLKSKFKILDHVRNLSLTKDNGYNDDEPHKQTDTSSREKDDHEP